MEIFPMKVSREEMAQNRIRILTEAAQLFREKGFAAMSVAEVMKAAGLTHGGYAAGARSDTADLGAFIDAYLSIPHGEHPELGCPMAALAGLMRDQAPEVRAAMAERLGAQLVSLADAMPGEDGVSRPRAPTRSISANTSSTAGPPRPNEIDSCVDHCPPAAAHQRRSVCDIDCLNKMIVGMARPLKGGHYGRAWAQRDGCDQ
jgi:TetR/AcrR family transcriptional repressor of nem operon